MNEKSDAVRVLEGLRKQAESLTDDGFLSRNFQQWHESATQALSEALGESDLLVGSFRKIQFEWDPEPLKKFSDAIETRTSLQFPFDAVQKERFGNALTEAREILTAAIALLRSKRD